MHEAMRCLLYNLVVSRRANWQNMHMHVRLNDDAILLSRPFKACLSNGQLLVGIGRAIGAHGLHGVILENS